MRRCVCSSCIRRRDAERGWRYATLMLVGSCIAVVVIVVLNLWSGAP